MANPSGWNPYNPLIIGAIAVILALAVFLMFRDGSDQSQQAGIQSEPPAATTPPPAQKTPALPGAAPTKPPAGGSGSQ